MLKQQEEYNIMQMATKSIIERCNGVLKAQFRCLLKHQILHYTPNKSGKIVNACVYLHNMCILAIVLDSDMNAENVEEIDFRMINNYTPEDDNRGRNLNSELVESRRIRDNVARCLCNR
ncbi:Harbinger transposase-derived nuclease domain [Cinara cedri]|uniref:Harbinger transposase-derived nuclease domain n=1 Tax=Cinara cedri TaxID=506608 RepID=A0A5E4N4W8_9HEMI|nr:Harbinger transposase-derived nuclease domain [Cinara cedri]